MAAVPKRRISSGRKRRKNSHRALKIPALSICPKCGNKKRPHFECPSCNYYGDGKDLKPKKTSTK